MVVYLAVFLRVYDVPNFVRPFSWDTSTGLLSDIWFKLYAALHPYIDQFVIP